jgi:phosphoribosyl 1,2-cyclic phosphate phosphodiesterase
MNPIEGDVLIDGEGGRVALHPFSVRHGGMDSLGFRVEDLAYLPDVSDMTGEAWTAVSGLDCWVVDALRREPHPTHVHLAQSLEWIAQAAPRRAILTNMHIDLDYATLEAETPANVTPAYDGLTVSYDV